MPDIFYRILFASFLGDGFLPHQEVPQTLETMADARIHKAKFIDIGEPGDSVGDSPAPDHQPLLNEKAEQIGNNSGTCIRTRIGHSFQCQWTLALKNSLSSKWQGRILMKGRQK